jgi:hypothetical protein
MRQLGHPQRAAGLRQLAENVEIAQVQTSLAFEIRPELAHESGVSPQQCSPGPQSAPARQRLGDHPVEETGHVAFGKYLLVQ